MIEIFITRADGVLIHAKDERGTWKRVLLSWDDVKKLELERKGYDVLREANRELNKRRSKS